jgi:hypothetical protein
MIKLGQQSLIVIHSTSTCTFLLDILENLLATSPNVSFDKCKLPLTVESVLVVIDNTVNTVDTVDTIDVNLVNIDSVDFNDEFHNRLDIYLHTSSYNWDLQSNCLHLYFDDLVGDPADLCQMLLGRCPGLFHLDFAPILIAKHKLFDMDL